VNLSGRLDKLFKDVCR